MILLLELITTALAAAHLGRCVIQYCKIKNDKKAHRSYYRAGCYEVRK